MLLGVNLFAQYIQVTPRDIVIPYTTGSRILAEYPTYTTIATGDKWLAQLYKDGGDNVISPLDNSGNPTGDDIMVTDALNANATQYVTVTLAAGNPYVTLLAIRFYPGTSQASQGDKVYMRIFNAHTIAGATKYMASVNLYTVPTSTATVEMDNILGWTASWIPVNEPQGYALTIESNYPGAPILFNGSPTGEVTPHTFPAPAAAGMYDLGPLPNIAWTTPGLNWDGGTGDLTYRFLGVLTPPPATTPAFYDGEIVYIAWDADAVPYILTWEGPNGLVVSGYHVFWQGGFVIDVTEPQWMTPPIAEGSYTWRVVPYVTDPAKGTKTDLSPVKVRIDSPKGDAVDAVDWHFTIIRNNPPAPALLAPMDGELLTTNMVDLQWGAPGYNIDSFFDVYCDPNPDPTTLVYHGSGMELFNDPVFTLHLIDLLDETTYYWYVKITDAVSGLFSISPIWSFTTPPGGGEVPVELSSFTAVYTAGFFVQLTWVVQSETNHLGYYVLRNSEENLDTATMLHTSPISTGNANGTQITYNFRDEEIEANQTYYYWLESVDMDGQSQFFGPINIVTTGENPQDPTPIVPLNTALLDAYPNPFTSQSSIPYYLKTSGDVKIEIYNAKGKLVHSYNAPSKAAGYHKISWDGRDLSGKPVSSGIYFYRMTSGKYTASKKIVLVK
jgi:hypothetical protein